MIYRIEMEMKLMEIEVEMIKRKLMETERLVNKESMIDMKKQKIKIGKIDDSTEYILCKTHPNKLPHITDFFIEIRRCDIDEFNSIVMRLSLSEIESFANDILDFVKDAKKSGK